MPLYEYRCAACDAVTTSHARVGHAPLETPCGQCQTEAVRIISKPSVHLAPGAKVRRLDPKYDRMVSQALRNTPEADPARLTHRRGDPASGRPDP